MWDRYKTLRLLRITNIQDKRKTKSAIKDEINWIRRRKVKDLRSIPKIEVYGVFFTTLELFDKNKVREEDLLYGKNLFSKWKDIGEFIT